MPALSKEDYGTEARVGFPHYLNYAKTVLGLLYISSEHLFFFVNRAAARFLEPSTNGRGSLSPAYATCVW